jgi:hypothetical protein
VLASAGGLAVIVAICPSARLDAATELVACTEKIVVVVLRVDVTLEACWYDVK